MSIFKKVFGKKKTDAEFKAEVLIKATEHWNESSDHTSFGEQDSVVKQNMPVYESNDKIKKKNIRTILLEIAERGETGALPISISDKTGVNQRDTATALDFLTKEHYVEAVNSTTGFKYYLTTAGRKYCISKEFNSDF